MRRTNTIKNIVVHFNNKSINDDIFDDVIDYEKRTIMAVYLKNSDIFYSGKFGFREEKGNDSWIALFDYIVVNKETTEEVYNPEVFDLKSSVVIPLSNIERIELVYEDDSKVWSRIINN